MEKSLYHRYAGELSQKSWLPYYEPEKQLNYIKYKMLHENLLWEEVITFINLGLDHEFYYLIHKITDPYSQTALVNKYNQLSEYYLPCDLEVIEAKYNGSEFMLRHDARVAFEAMCRAAEEEGLSLKAISSFRSYKYQQKVYLSKYTYDMRMEDYQTERDRVSARPGHSEHQTGLAVDINDLEQTFEDTPESRWLVKNSYHYGFILRYPKGKESITGYDYEPWHFRYIGTEYSRLFFLSGLTYDEYYIRFLKPSEVNLE